jgi:flagellar assembly protein FliH
MQKEMQTAYERWELASFGDDRPSVVARRAAEQQARQQAAALVPSADELAAIREAARAEGYAAGQAAGHADGLAQGRGAAQAETARLKGIADGFGQAVARADETIAGDVLELALHLARAMTRSAFEIRPELVVPVVREAIGYLPVLQQPARLMLNPADAALVQASIGDELEKTGWRVVEDAQVARGGCRIDTASNQIDAQAATRWQRLTQAFGKHVEWLA